VKTGRLPAGALQFITGPGNRSGRLASGHYRWKDSGKAWDLGMVNKISPARGENSRGKGAFAREGVHSGRVEPSD